ncbi:MAG TPA: methylmalonyl-CoA epimerase [Longilinea sp.]|nr:methylmalonyl-CoA epimerase [Longilinea sp.]
MAKIKKIDHVAVVVADIDAALAFWRDALGIELSHVEDVPSQKSTVAFLPVGEGEIELVKPTSDDSGVAKFLQERGGGMHHLCLEVDDISAKLAELKAKGVRLINEEPQVLPGRKMAFIHPKSTGGVLIELYEVTK